MGYGDRVASRRPAGTKERIQAAALELFAEQGVQRTSLQQIADRLGLTKPAIYYHFASREDLVRSLVQPMIDAAEALLAAQEAAPGRDPRALLEAYVDMSMEHRAVTRLVVSDPATLGYLDLAARVVEWRRRVIALLVGADADLAAQVRAVVAIGGLADCTVMFPDVADADLKVAAVDAALATLHG